MIRPAFGDARLRAATEAGDVSAAVYARIGFGDHAQLDAHGDPLDGDMVHLARDTPFGCCAAASTWASPARSPSDAADELGLALLRHCYTEFTYLSRFLPSIYYGEHGNGEKPRCPGRRQGVGPGGRSMLRGFIPAFVPPAMRAAPTPGRAPSPCTGSTSCTTACRASASLSCPCGSPSAAWTAPSSA